MIGPLRAEFALPQHEDPSHFLSAFSGPDSHGGRPDLSIAALCEPDAVLDRLVPLSRASAYSLVEDGCYALWQPAPGEVLNVHDLASGRGFVWLPTRQAFESFRSRPALPLIHAHVADTEWAPVHAGAVGRNGRFLLLAGPGGSGKSTAAVACASAGWDYAGDDFVLVAPDRRRVEPIYASARVRPDVVSSIADFVDRAQISLSHDFGDPRHELRLGAGRTGDGIAGGEIAAILLPRRTGATAPTIRPAGPAETFYAAVTITVAQLPGMREQLTSKLTALVRSVPAFVVDTGTDPSAIAPAFEQVLSEL